MNREIKFRVRDRLSKQVIGYESNSAGYWMRRLASETDWTVGTFDAPPYQVDREQYIGLKDKNDAEVYETDIIDCAPHMPRGKYGNIYLKAVEFKTYHPDMETFAGFEPFSGSDYGEASDKCEVIGNIDENPDLLK